MGCLEPPGNKHIKEVFADGIHLNNVGSYVVGCTYFATLYRANAKGLPAEPYKVMDARLAEVIQDTVWRVVSTHELAGIAPPKARGNKTSFKGWELYVWQDGTTVRLALLPGTNRLKNDTEITAAAVTGIDAIKAKLDELKPGESISLCGRRLLDSPPNDTGTQLRQYCRSIGLEVLR